MHEPISAFATQNLADFERQYLLELLGVTPEELQISPCNEFC